MLLRVIVAIAAVLVALLIAQLVQRRRQVDPPTQQRLAAPSQLDRGDFGSADTEWLVVVFTSDTCSTCADVVSKAQVLASELVAVEMVSFQAGRELHDRYHIDSVPMVLVADRDGVVVYDHVGPVTATDLWAAVAEARSD